MYLLYYKIFRLFHYFDIFFSILADNICLSKNTKRTFLSIIYNQQYKTKGKIYYIKPFGMLNAEDAAEVFLIIIMLCIGLVASKTMAHH